MNKEYKSDVVHNYLTRYYYSYNNITILHIQYFKDRIYVRVQIGRMTSGRHILHDDLDQFIIDDRDKKITKIIK